MKHPTKDWRQPGSEVATARLATGALLFIWGIRQWLVAVRDRQCIKRALMIPHYRLECVTAIYSLDALMRSLCEGAERKIEIRCPHHGTLSQDEQQLLQLIRSTQQPNPDAAARHAAHLVDPDHSAGLREAAADYARQLQCAGLGLSSPPQLELMAGGIS